MLASPIETPRVVVPAIPLTYLSFLQKKYKGVVYKNNKSTKESCIYDAWAEEERQQHSQKPRTTTGTLSHMSTGRARSVSLEMSCSAPLRSVSKYRKLLLMFMRKWWSFSNSCSSDTQQLSRFKNLHKYTWGNIQTFTRTYTSICPLLSLSCSRIRACTVLREKFSCPKARAFCNSKTSKVPLPSRSIWRNHCDRTCLHHYVRAT